MNQPITLDQLIDRIRATLDRDGRLDWDGAADLARTIAIDIDREFGWPTNG